MRRAFPFALALVLALAAQSQSPASRARGAVQELAAHIRSLLAAELKAGGFEGAVSVCAAKAQQETRRYAQEHNIQIRRVSTKARNSTNQPDPWERDRLSEWAALLANQQPLPEAAEGSTPTGRYRLLVPIRVQAMCLTCHGAPSQIPPEVKSILARHYPNDEATGYRNGDLRGAFSVILR